MQLSIDEIGVTKIRETEFFIGTSVFDTLVYFAPLDKMGGPEQRWMVINMDSEKGEDGYISIFTTEEMKLLYRSMKDFTGNRTVRASKETGYRFLVRSGKLRMKLRDGCAGCRRFWEVDCREGQCNRCHRCLTCCGKVSVPFSCESNRAYEARKRIGHGG